MPGRRSRGTPSRGTEPSRDDRAMIRLPRSSRSRLGSWFGSSASESGSSSATIGNSVTSLSSPRGTHRSGRAVQTQTTSTNRDIGSFIPAVFWTRHHERPDRSSSKLTYIAAVTTDGHSTTRVDEDQLPYDQQTQYANAEALASELLTAMAAARRSRNVDDDDDDDDGPAEVFSRVLYGLARSNAAHSRTKLHWLNPFTFARDFPEVAEKLARGENFMSRVQADSDDQSSDEDNQQQLVQRVASLGLGSYTGSYTSPGVQYRPNQPFQGGSRGFLG